MDIATILALEARIFNNVLCSFEPESQDATFCTVRTTLEELRRELWRQPVVTVVF